MEEVLQRVFAILLAVIIFFIFPLYIAFEKKDDISYALALKITTNFVDNVTSKGYISLNMYNDYISDMSVTDNVYKIKIEHKAKKYTPIIQTYKITDGGDTYERETSVADLEYIIHKDYLYNGGNLDFKFDKKGNKFIKGNSAIIESNGKVYQIGYKQSEELYNWEQISDILEDVSTDNFIEDSNYASLNYNDIPSFVVIKDLIDDELLDGNNKIYTMSEGDEFNVIVENTNVTIATVLFDTLTFGANSGNDTKVYINYGGIVQNEDYKSK